MTRDFRRTTLTAGQRPTVRALAEAMFSPDGGADAGALDALVDDFDQFISAASKTLRFGLVLMLYAIRWSPLFYFRFKAFEDLTVDERLHHLERLERAKLKQLPLIVIAYKTVFTMVFYEDEAEQRWMGYPGVERKRWLAGRSLPLAPRDEENAA